MLSRIRPRRIQLRTALILTAIVAVLLLATAVGRIFAAASGDPILLAAGDISGCGDYWSQVTAQLVEKLPGTVVVLGDNAYENGSPQDYQCYDQAWGRVKARTHPVPGNHEYNTPGAAGYFGYFEGAAGDPTKGYYSYDLGSWHIVALNSEIDVSAGSPEEKWLRADLASHPNLCTLAYWHRPRFSSGENGNNAHYQAIWQALYHYGVDVVLNGHDHDYERLAPETPEGILDRNYGIREFVVGTGGKSHSGFVTTVANSEVRNDQTFGVLQMTLHVTSYDWTFVPADGNGFSDSGSEPCHGPHPAPSMSPTIFDSDTFGRNVSAGWGISDSGVNYQVDQAPANFAVDSSLGRVLVPAANMNRTVLLEGVSALNADAYFQVRTDKAAMGGDEFVYLIARRSSTGDAYLARVRLTASGQVMLQATSEIGGMATLLGFEKPAAKLLFEPGQPIDVRIKVVGVKPTTLLMKAWDPNSPEPVAWQYWVADSSAALQSAGGLGLRAYLGRGYTQGPVTFGFSSLDIRSVEAP